MAKKRKGKKEKSKSKVVVTNKQVSEKLVKIKQFKDKLNHFPKDKRTLGQKIADKMTNTGGSWPFILLLVSLIIVWAGLNSFALLRHWDPYPFILLNLALSCLAALQAPIILMSQKRSGERDRAKAERDYCVNRKAEREVENIQKDLEEIKALIKEKKSSRKK